MATGDINPVVGTRAPLRLSEPESSNAITFGECLGFGDIGPLAPLRVGHLSQIRDLRGQQLRRHGFLQAV